MYIPKQLSANNVQIRQWVARLIGGLLDEYKKKKLYFQSHLISPPLAIRNSCPYYLHLFRFVQDYLDTVMDNEMSLGYKLHELYYYRELPTIVT